MRAHPSLAASDADRRVLESQIARKMTLEDIVGYETMLGVNPADTGLHDDVALLYLGLGKPAEAIRHFEASAAAAPA